MHVEALIHGNVTLERAQELSNMVERALEKGAGTRPLAKAQLLKDREVELEAGTHRYFETTTKVHKSSCLETYYQCGQQSTRKNALIELLAQIIQEPCFDGKDFVKSSSYWYIHV